jgi:quinol monooxygenase YgiN
VIAKESQRRDGKSSARDLIKYLTDSKNNNERIIYSQFVNCLGDDPELAMKEIEAVHAMNSRAKGNKMYHLIVSFRDGDNPTPAQLREIEQGMAETLGLGDHQRLSVVHGDTDHLHLHLAISKIHPTTYRMVEPYRDHYALSEACRQFEQAFGLQVDNGIPNGERLTAQAGDYEAHQGLESFQRWAQGEPKQRLQAALDRPDATWPTIHQALAGYNLEIKPRGAGFVVVDRDDDRLRMKASQLGRGFGKAALEKRLGVFESVAGKRPRADARFSERPRGDGKDARAQLWTIYQRERQAQRETKKTQWVAYKTEREKAFREVALDNQRKRRLVQTDRSLRAAERKAQYSVLRMDRARREAALREQFASQRHAMKKEHRNETFQQFLEHRADIGDELPLRRCAPAAGRRQRRAPRYWPAIPARAYRGCWRWISTCTAMVTSLIAWVDPIRRLRIPRRMCWSGARTRRAMTRRSKLRCVSRR